jgi:hypothetical protein
LTPVLPFASAFTRAWAALYTRGLPAGLRSERRAEIDCDLWEHQRRADLEKTPETGTATEILLRLCFGIPSDIFWRLEAGADARSERGTSMNESILMKGLLASAALIALFPTVIGASALMGQGEWGSDTERIGAGSVQMFIGLLIIAGLVLSRARPRLGLALVIVPVLALAAMWYWVAVIILPIGLVMAAIAYLRGHPLGWPRGPRAA